MRLVWQIELIHAHAHTPTTTGTNMSSTSLAEQSKPVAKVAKKPDDAASVYGKRMIVFSAEEASEPEIHLVKVDSAPRAMRRQLARNMAMGKYTYNFIHFEDGTEGLDGLLDEDEEDEDVIEAVIGWFKKSCTSENCFYPPFQGSIDFSVSIAQV